MGKIKITKTSPRLKALAPARTLKVAAKPARKPEKPAKPAQARPAPAVASTARSVASARPLRPVATASNPALTLQRAEGVASQLGLDPLDALDRAALRAIVDGEDAWVVDPDGARARARFFAASAASSRPALLIGPSLALLTEERAALLRAGLPTALLHRSSERVAAAELAKLLKPGPLIVLATSDALRAPEVERALEHAGVQRVAIDAAQLLAPESQELRPSFALIPPLLAGLPGVKLHVLVRAARPEVRRSVCQRLGLARPLLLEAPLLRDQVVLDTLPVRGERRNASLLEALKSLSGPGVVLCASPHDVDAAYAVLVAGGVAACRAHAGLPKPELAAALSRFQAPASALVLLTTSAYAPDSGLTGLGERIDEEPKAGFGAVPPRKDLRFIVHHQAPASLEQYASEVSWLGRDGRGGVAVMLFDGAQLSLNDAILEQQRLREKQVSAVYRALEARARDEQATKCKPLTVEWLALHSGLSRRTTERLVLLLADGGNLRRSSDGIQVVVEPSQLSSACDALAHRLEELRRADRPRLAAVERLAEGDDCRRRAFSRHFGLDTRETCGRCVACQGGRGRARANAARSEPAAPRGR